MRTQRHSPLSPAVPGPSPVQPADRRPAPQLPPGGWRLASTARRRARPRPHHERRSGCAGPGSRDAQRCSATHEAHRRLTGQRDAQRHAQPSRRCRCRHVEAHEVPGDVAPHRSDAPRQQRPPARVRGPLRSMPDHDAECREQRPLDEHTGGARRHHPVEQQIVCAIHEHTTALVIDQLGAIGSREDQTERVGAVAQKRALRDQRQHRAPDGHPRRRGPGIATQRCSQGDSQGKAADSRSRHGPSPPAKAQPSPRPDRGKERGRHARCEPRRTGAGQCDDDRFGNEQTHA